jgi:hypothetical protein
MAEKSNGAVRQQNEARRALIAVRAYQIFESEGRPGGCALRHWLAAEREVTERETAKAKPARPRPTSLMRRELVALEGHGPMTLR